MVYGQQIRESQYTVQLTLSVRAFIGNGKAVPLQAWTGPADCRMLCLQDVVSPGCYVSRMFCLQNVVSPGCCVSRMLCLQDVVSRGC